MPPGVVPRAIPFRPVGAKTPVTPSNAPGFRIPWGHTHNVQEEVYLVVSGSMRAKLGDDVVELNQWDAVRVPKETMRSFEGGPEGAEVIAVGAPNTGPGDAVVEQDWWLDLT